MINFTLRLLVRAFSIWLLTLNMTASANNDLNDSLQAFNKKQSYPHGIVSAKKQFKHYTINQILDFIRLPAPVSSNGGIEIFLNHNGKKIITQKKLEQMRKQLASLKKQKKSNLFTHKDDVQSYFNPNTIIQPVTLLKEINECNTYYLLTSKNVAAFKSSAPDNLSRRPVFQNSPQFDKRQEYA